MSKAPSDVLVQVIGRIDLFNGVSASALRALLSVSEHRVQDAEQVLCSTGDAPTELLILCAGECSRRRADTAESGSLRAFALLGGVEILSEQRFSSNVQTLSTCHILSIARQLFLDVLDNDKEAQLVMYRNLAQILTRQRQQRTHQGEIEQQQHLRDRIGSLEEELRTVAAQLQSAQAAEQPKVLVVDDEPECRWLVRHILSNYEVYEASSGSEALDIMRSRSLDLVITDIRMPQMDGCTLLMNLRTLYPDLPIVATSGALDIDSLSHYDFNAFVGKPIDPKQLRDAVDSLTRAR